MPFPYLPYNFNSLYHSEIFKAINDALEGGEAKSINNTKGIIDNVKTSIEGFFSRRSVSKTELFDEKDIQCIENYNKEINNCTGTQTAFNRTMLDASDKAQKFVEAANGNVVKLEGITKASKAAELGMKALAMAENMAIMAIVSFAATKLFEWYDNVAHAQEYAMERSEKLTSTYESERSTLDENISKYKELGQKLNDTSLSAEELQSVKQQLSSVQDINFVLYRKILYYG